MRKIRHETGALMQRLGRVVFGRVKFGQVKLGQVKKVLQSLPVLFVLTACTAPGGPGGAPVDTSVSERPAGDVARDGGRKPFQVLEFLGVQPGMRTLDVIAAGGYYTEVLANAVGPQGLVYAQNPAVVLRFNDGANDRAMTDRLAGGRLPNVQRLDREFGDLGLLADSIDVAITALNFHDIYNRSPEAAHEVLLDIRQVLKPGGVLGVIDHVSNPGADHAKLHRLDPLLAVAVAEQAGFKVEQSDLLANPDDDHTLGPFAEGLRGKTDRFVLKLTKPLE